MPRIQEIFATSDPQEISNEETSCIPWFAMFWTSAVALTTPPPSMPIVAPRRMCP
ncbi:hypothetical protein GCM10025734_51430 [Kitasatospora paranensis]